MPETRASRKPFDPGAVPENLLPSQDNVYNLGSASFQWKDLFLGDQLISTVATGTAPFTVASTTKVTNLNADMLNGYHVGTTGSTIPLCNGSNRWTADQTFAVNPLIEQDVTIIYGSALALGMGAITGVTNTWFEMKVQSNWPYGTGVVTLVDQADSGIPNREPAISVDPRFRVYSSDGTQANDYIEMYHDQTNAVLNWGNGDLSLPGNVNLGSGNLTTTGTITGVNVTSGTNPGHLHSTLVASDGSPVALSADTLGNVSVPDDNLKLSFGAAADASISYKGTNLQIVPDEVGNGGVWIHKGDFDAVDFSPSTYIYYGLITTARETAVRNVFGLWAGGQYDGASTMTKGVFGLNSFGYFTSNADSSSRVEGGFYEARLFGTGTIAKAGGLRVRGQMTAAGTLTEGYGLEVMDFSNTGGGTLTTNQGIKINDLTAATNNYGIRILSDSIGLTIGANDDATIRFDGSDVTLDNSLVFVGASTGLSYGEIYAHSAAAGITSVAQNDWVQITAFDTNGVSNNTTPDHTNDHITITKAGIYLVEWSWSGSGPATNHDWDFHIARNNRATDDANTSAHLQTPSAQNLVSTGGGGLIDCAANDTIELWVQRLSAGNNIVLTTENCNIRLTQIGGT